MENGTNIAAIATHPVTPDIASTGTPLDAAVNALTLIAVEARKAADALHAPTAPRIEVAAMTPATVAQAALPIGALSAGPKTSSMISPLSLRAGENLVWQSSGGADPRFGHVTGVAAGTNWECRYNTDKQNVFAQFGPYLPVVSGLYRVES